MNQGLISYLQQHIRTTPERLKRFTHNKAGVEYPKRMIFNNLERHIDLFLENKSPHSMIVIPGFRGVGKTTVMAQLCSAYKNKGLRVLFLSIEEAKSLFDVGIAELMTAYEEILGIPLESVKDPICIFLDEVQTDPHWAVILKILFEKVSKVFFCCSGSAAVVLQTTPNLARRAIFEKMPPLSFIEYQMIKNNIAPPKVDEEIKQIIYFSKNAQEVYDKLISIKTDVNQYWSGVNRLDIRQYLSSGTLPFSFMMPNETVVYDAISLLLDKIIKIDLPLLGHFDMNTLGVVKRILFAIAENDATSLSDLEQRFGINRLTIANIFEALEKAEVLLKIPAYGSNMTAAKKANKYLFMAPAIRMSFFYITGLESTYLTRLGKLLEDSVGSHLYREFILKGPGAIRYDSAQGGADFILQILNNKQILIEVGMGDKNIKQIASSMKKIKSDYNLIFSQSELTINHELNTVFIPLDYYFLM